MEVEEHRRWSTSSSTSDSEKEEPLRGRSSRKLDVAENVNGLAKIQLQPEKEDENHEIVLISAATDKSVVLEKEEGEEIFNLISAATDKSVVLDKEQGEEIFNLISVATDKSVVLDKEQVGGFKHLFSDSRGPNGVQGHIFENNYGDEVFSPITKGLDAQRSPFNEINDQHEESHKDSSTPELLLQPSEESSNGFIVEKSSPEIIAVNDEVNLLTEADYEETEYDVETVLEKQNTHDLYCPNCRSCITRRVILCKRKRTVKNPKDAKRNKFDTEADLDVDPTGDQGGTALDTIHEGGSASADNGVDQVKETEVFRCLSCFSFFMPGNCFRGFRILPSGEKTETENIKNSETISVSKKHWWKFMFHFDKEQTSETGHNRDLQTNDINRDLQTSDIGTSLAFSPPSDSSSAPTNGEINKTELHNGMVGDAIVNVGKKPDGAIDNGRGNLSRDYPWAGSDSKSDIVTHTEYRPGSAVAKQPEDGLKIIVTEAFNTYNASVIEGQMIDHHDKETILGDLPLKKKQVEASHDDGSPVEDENFLNKNDTNLLPPGVAWPPVIGTKVDIHIEKPLTDNTGGSDTIIIIKDKPNELVVPQSSEDVIDVARTGEALQTTHTSGVSGLEIVKSIVYGGLIETITSLGIVSSAAGADATTLNILALSIANLIGGFFLIIHNIWDLKAEHDANTSTRRSDRYQEILGRRQNFWVHATLALLSFVVFGLVPPVIYGFSFRESDDSDFKLIAVAAASLLCIILLAIGKAFVQKLSAKDYAKTLMYYVTSGFMASGISYVAGKFVKKLLEDLGLFESTEALNLSGIQTTATETPWKSFY